MTETRHPTPTQLPARESGQVLLLVLGFVVILVALITVVVDASRVFLYRRALAAAVDGAVTAAVQAVDETAIYTDPGAFEAGRLPLDERAALAAVQRYVTENKLTQRFSGFAVVGVSVGPDGTTVVVSFAATVDLPFVGLVPSRYATGVVVTVSAAGHSRIS